MRRKKINRIRRGKELERKFLDYLRKNNYISNAWLVPSIRWGAKDFLGLFDLAGLTKSGYLFLAQIKKNPKHIYSAWKKIKEWAKDKQFTRGAILLVATFNQKAKRWEIRTTKEFLERIKKEGFKVDEFTVGGICAEV